MVPYMAMSPIATGTSHHCVPVPSPSVSSFSLRVHTRNYSRPSRTILTVYSLLDTVLHTVQVGFRTSHVPRRVSCFSDLCRSFRHMGIDSVFLSQKFLVFNPGPHVWSQSPHLDHLHFPRTIDAIIITASTHTKQKTKSHSYYFFITK